ncbi:uL15m family ribosomal protein [Candidatus Undinarchaeota archaeon]
MTVKIRSKNERQRGYSSHGWGHKKKHRGAGNRGGRGRAGYTKHKFVYALIHGHYEGGKLAETGFKTHPSQIEHIRSINLFQLEELAGDKKEINLADYNIQKVLGGGKFSKKLTVKADYFSASALEKIEKAGGKAVPLVESFEKVQEAPKEKAKESKPAEKKEKSESKEIKPKETSE